MLFSSIYSKCSSDLKLVCSPISTFFSTHFDLFCQNSGLLGNSRIKSEHFSSLFNMLIYIRLYPNSEYAKEMVSFLKGSKLPTGFSKTVNYLPICGTFKNVKGMMVNVILDPDLKKNIESNHVNSHSYQLANFISRELSSSRNANFETFDEVSILSNTQNFILNSIIEKDFTSDSFQCRMHCNDHNPEMNVGLAVSFVFNLSSTTECLRCLTTIIGSVAHFDMTSSQYNGNCHLAIDLLFNQRLRREGTNGIKVKNHQTELPNNSKNESKSSSVFSSNIDVNKMSSSTLVNIITESVISILARTGYINNGPNSSISTTSSVDYPLAL